MNLLYDDQNSSCFEFTHTVCVLSSLPSLVSSRSSSLSLVPSTSCPPRVRARYLVSTLAGILANLGIFHALSASWYDSASFTTAQPRGLGGAHLELRLRKQNKHHKRHVIPHSARIQPERPEAGSRGAFVRSFESFHLT